jgi:tetratricopeptide (TPR) repeat protein
VENAAILDTLATAYGKQGDYDKAISTEEQAIKVAESTANFPDQEKASFKATLETLKKSKNKA